MATNALFKPYSHGNLSLTNRIVMAPMTRQFSPNGIPTPDVAAYYKRRAQGGTGLIITEGTTVNDNVATMDANIPQFHGEQALSGWQTVVNEVHSVGGKIMPQLWHVGMARVAEKAPFPDLPSAGPSGLFTPDRGMAVSEIAYITYFDRFRRPEATSPSCKSVE